MNGIPQRSCLREGKGKMAGGLLILGLLAILVKNPLQVPIATFWGS